MRKVMFAAVAVAAVVVLGATLTGCRSGEGDRDIQVTNEQGDVVTVLPGGGEYYVLRRRCEGTTAVYTFKDSSGYDFQVVPGDPKCPGVAK